jgi:YfiH family protein
MNGSGGGIPSVITRIIVQSFEASPALRDAGFFHGFTGKSAPGDELVALGLDPQDVFLVSQVHGAGVVCPGAGAVPAAMRAEKGDAIVLSAGQTGAVRVADCVPVLVGDPVSGRAAAIHAGWRGVVGGVVPAALSHLRGNPRGMLAAIGPCIESCCFEVGDDVASTIEMAVPAPGVVARRAGGKGWVDLVAAVRAQLEASGVAAANIERVGSCTRCSPEKYWSYRREGASAGRIMGVIRARD